MLPIYLAMIETEEERDKCTQVYEQYRETMLKVTYRVLKDHHLAEDAVHEAFLHILRHFEDFYDISCHQTRREIVIISRNVAIDVYRKRQKKLTISFDEAFQGSDDGDTVLPESLLTELPFGEITDMVSLLPEKQRDVLALYYANDFSVSQIAQKLEITESAAKKRLERARQALRLALENTEGTVV